MLKRAVMTGLIVMSAIAFITPQEAMAYNYGDYRSSTLISRAWEALTEKDLEAVLAYTNKCVELYANQAQKMQESLSGYPTGNDDEIFAYWALNDVATGFFIQGEAYRTAGLLDEAKEAYRKVAKEYSYGQCWDVGGWFWKPAEAANEKLAMLESGSNLDFGDYKSATLAGKAWESLAQNDLTAVKAYTNKCMELYGRQAAQMQKSLTEYAWESKEKIFSYWALNDVGTTLFILAEAYRQAGEADAAKETYQELVDKYYYAQCWDPQGWFWKPAEAAQQKLDEISS